MEKQIADKKIFEYRDRIFGFALEKVHNIDEAAELASDIVYEVYRSFLNADTIANFDGYVYRIARNVWAKYLYKLETGRRFEYAGDFYELEIESKEESERIQKKAEEETIALLKKEIGFLSKRQRLVIYLHYYDKLSVEAIAKRLDLAPGTVKWHLSDARGKLKEGMEMSRKLDQGQNLDSVEQDLEINPIRFISMGHSGIPGTTGATDSMFDTRLKQNIAWACYWEPKTLEEIARLVGVPKLYIADELLKLVDFGYIDQLDNSQNPKYRTNMLLTDIRREQKRALDQAKDSEKEDENGIFDRAAESLCDEYLPAVLKDFESAPGHWGLSCDGDDLNFLKYDVVMMAVLALRCGIYRENGEVFARDFQKIRVKRPDGGEFLAQALVTDDTWKDTGRGKNEEEAPYWCNGVMTRNNHCITHEECLAHPGDAFENVSIDCRFSDRKGGWMENRNSDWESLVRFMNQGREALKPEEYKRLCDKGYLLEDRVQPAVFRYALKENETLNGCAAEFLLERMPVPAEILKLSAGMDKRMYAIKKRSYPEHMFPAVKLEWCTGCISNPEILPRIIEKLLDRGVLKPITAAQRKAVFSILCVQG